MQAAHHFSVVTLIAVAMGCTAQSAPDGNDITAEAPAATESAEPNAVPQETESTEIELTMVSPAELADQLAARKGKVVLLDMWATW